MAAVDKVRVGVVDGHDLLVAGVRALLSSRSSPARFVVGARTVEGLLASPHPCDVVVLGVRLCDDSDPEENVRRLTRAGHRVLLHADPSQREALPILNRTGAAGLAWKHNPARTLLEAVVTVAHGGTWHDPHRGPAVGLTNRETEVLRLHAAGQTYAQTAAALHPPVSVESVKTYLTRIRRRYAEAGRPASTRTELRVRAIEDGILTPGRRRP